MGSVSKSIKETLNDQKNLTRAEKREIEEKWIEEQYTLSITKKTITKWLYIEDTEVIDIIFAFTLSEDLKGDPLWLFLIAPPGGAKTEILRGIYGPRYYHLSDLTSKTFVSGLMLGKGENRKKIQDLLPQLDKKILIFKDFTTILEKNKDERAEIFAQLREIYDGSFAKKFGTLDHKVEYHARFGLIAGVTPIIDRYWKLMQQLGERFLKYRWQEDADKTTRRAEAIEGKEKEMRAEITYAVQSFLKRLPVKNPELPKELVEPIILSAKFLALARTPVQIQHGAGDFFHDYIPTPERPTRLVKQLKKLSKALAVVRGRDIVTEEDVKTTIKVALSTCPQDRLEVLRAVEKKQGKSLYGTTAGEIRKDVNIPETSIRHICEQLTLLELLQYSKVSKDSGGYQSTITYYSLGREAHALYPDTILEASKKIGGDAATNPKDKVLIYLRKQKGPIEVEKVLDDVHEATDVLLDNLLSQGDIYSPKPGLIGVLE